LKVVNDPGKRAFILAQASSWAANALFRACSRAFIQAWTAGRLVSPRAVGMAGGW
jgi:hypothetical protein